MKQPKMWIVWSNVYPEPFWTSWKQNFEHPCEKLNTSIPIRCPSVYWVSSIALVICGSVTSSDAPNVFTNADHITSDTVHRKHVFDFYKSYFNY
jgi:hypothetical protein